MNDKISTFVRIKQRVRTYIYESHPAKVVALGYLSYIIIGWLVLCIPLMYENTISALDNLFIATSAISTTGLTTIDVAKSYTFLGELVILALIQVGGVGYMTFGSYIILTRKSEFSDRRVEISKTIFSVPESYRIDKFLRSVIAFTLIIESLGVIALYIIFRSENVASPLWSAIFHSVSAFCTAGFSLFSSSFENFSGNFWLNLVISILSYMGAIGFIVCVDYWRKIRGKVSQVTLTSKIILRSTFWLSIVGAVLLFFAEPSINQNPVNDRIIQSVFQAMTAITTVGFNTINIGALSNASLLVIILLMVVGASPSGTGGGLKSTTFSALFGVMKSTLKGDLNVTFWGKTVPQNRIWSAVASLLFYTTALIIGTYLLELSEKSSFVSNLFETASALGTVGLSTGITSSLTDIGKLILIVLMYSGRLGPLTFSIALFYRDTKQNSTSDSDLAV